MEIVYFMVSTYTLDATLIRCLSSVYVYRSMFNRNQRKYFYVSYSFICIHLYMSKVSINIYVNTNICLHIARPVSMFCSAACFHIFLGNLGTSHLRSWLSSALDLDPVLCCAACSGCCQAQLQLLVGSVLLNLVNDLILLVEGEGGGQVLLHVRVELLYV